MSKYEMEQYDKIIELGIATSEELNLAFNMTDNGWTWTLNRVVDIRTGYKSLESYIECELEEEI